MEIALAGVGALARDAKGADTATASAVARGREERLRAMVAAEFNFIWRTLRGLGVPPASADDATQKVFWIAARKLDQIVVGSERAFLFATARGVAANERRLRARTREVADDETLTVAIDGALNPEQAAERAQARRLLEQILSEMAEDTRTVFVLFELEGVSTPEIAELLDIPIGTAASRLRRARVEFESLVSRLKLDARRP